MSTKLTKAELTAIFSLAIGATEGDGRAVTKLFDAQNQLVGRFGVKMGYRRVGENFVKEGSQ